MFHTPTLPVGLRATSWAPMKKSWSTVTWREKWPISVLAPSSLKPISLMLFPLATANMMQTWSSPAPGNTLPTLLLMATRLTSFSRCGVVKEIWKPELSLSLYTATKCL